MKTTHWWNAYSILDDTDNPKIDDTLIDEALPTINTGDKVPIT